MARSVRLFHANGPLQALTAASVVAYLDADDPMENVLIFESELVGAHDQLKRAALHCAAAARYSGVIDLGDGSDLSTLGEVGDRHVGEVVLMHNILLHRRVMEAFPDAKRTVYGDAFGQVYLGFGPEAVPVDRVVTPLPQPKRPGTLDETPWEAVPRDVVLSAVQEARGATPGLEEADRELARFAEGGVVVLTSNLAGYDFGTTPAREAKLVVELIRRAAGDDRVPVVLKPHPRATLGVVGEAARRLRRSGHAVRVWSDDRYGAYPIELFGTTLAAAGSIRSIASSATVSLSWLYGIQTEVDLDPRLARRTIGVWHADRFVRMSHYYDTLQRRLPGWRADEPLPVWPPQTLPLWARITFRLAAPLRWREDTRDYRRRATRWPREEPREGEVLVEDRAAALRWHVPSGPGGADAERVAAAVVREGPVESRIEQTLGRLEGLGCEGVGVTAGVLPPSHAPRWRQAVRRLTGVPVVSGATLRAAEVEEHLERGADVTEARRVAPGVVRFECALRRSAPVPATAA